MQTQINALCARLGADRLLVQGAGGNVSWKDGDTLWIKASGTWLRDTLTQNIFVPVDLPALLLALSAGQFDVVPKALQEGGLRPSIETVLHALMPQRVVVHVHAIEVLARVVRADAATAIPARLSDLPWRSVYVPYRKPGAPLAQAVAEALLAQPGAQLVFLANHGLVLAADTVEDIDGLLQAVLERLACEVRHIDPPELSRLHPLALPGGGVLAPLPQALLHVLAIDASLFGRVLQDWALYPDHVVFLGAEAITCTSSDIAVPMTRSNVLPSDQPVFVHGVGVFSLSPLSEAKLAQLACYLDVILRQPDGVALSRLVDADVAALLGWDAEKYRQGVNR